MLQGINLFYLSVAVFLLLLIGIFLTYREFHQQTLEMKEKDLKKSEKNQPPQ
jgi:uncharacterized membrane protein